MMQVFQVREQKRALICGRRRHCAADAMAGEKSYGHRLCRSCCLLPLANTVGSSQSHSNLMPSLCISFIIALQGIFPSRN
jgi:microcystin-dependent protein